MKTLVLAVAVGAAFAGSIAHAEEKKPDNELNFNLSLASEYRYRGISQSRFEPALHAGHQMVKNNGAFNYTDDWKVGVTKHFSAASVTKTF